jgi:hypothetical protein
VATNYAGALDTTTQLRNDWQDDTDSTSGADLGTSTGVGALATFLRNTSDAIRAIETELGVNPSGNAVDVVTRLNLRQTVKKTADQAITVQTLTNVTDLAVVLAASTDYRFGFTLPFNGATARGVGWGLTFSGTTTRINARVAIGGAAASGTDAETLGWITASAGSVTTAAMASTGNFQTLIEGTIEVGATGGTLQLQARQGTGTTAGNMNVLKAGYGFAEA